MGSSFLKFLVLGALLFAPHASAEGKKYLLYGAMDREEYQLRLRSAGRGDILVFEGGVEFKIEGYLGQGYTTRVYDLGNGKALRVPLGQAFENKATQVVVDGGFYNRSYLASQSSLEKAGVVVPKLFVSESAASGSYLVVERIEVRYTMQDFIDMYKKGKISAEALASRYGPALKTFAESTAQLTYIGDFKPSQVGWDEVHRRFVLLDWTNGVDQATHVGDETVFNSSRLTGNYGYTPDMRWDQLPDSLRQDLVKSVHVRRTQITLDAPPALGTAGIEEATAPAVPRARADSVTTPAACPNGLRAKIRAIPGVPTVRGH